jgi:peptidoglycan LD-endopeptidase LytH
LWFAAAAPRAVALKATLRRGQRSTITVTIASARPVRVFLDLFEQRAGTIEPVAHAVDGTTTLVHDVTRDAEYILRIQPELLQDARVELEWRSGPTLTLPVEGATRRSIQSYFLAPRDGGAREHQGLDIFAPRGTPVVAAADGVVTSVGTNRLGGNVVWVARPFRRESFYYAHLDTQTATAGRRVKAGDVLGTVGATGNAAGGPPHLHFGIYTGRGAVDPLPFLEPAPNHVAAPLSVPLGDYRRLRIAQRIAGRSLPAGTIVEIVGATARGARVRLPDGVEGYAAARSTIATTARLRAVRLRAQTAIANAPVHGVPMDVLPSAATVDVLGTFGEALFIRTPAGLAGWIATDAGA